MSGLDEMVEGYMDGGDKDAPRPSGNRSLAYRWGFANRLRDRGEMPLHRCFERALRIADRIIARHDALAKK